MSVVGFEEHRQLAVSVLFQSSSSFSRQHQVARKCTPAARDVKCMTKHRGHFTDVALISTIKLRTIAYRWTILNIKQTQVTEDAHSNSACAADMLNNLECLIIFMLPTDTLSVNYNMMWSNELRTGNIKQMFPQFHINCRNCNENTLTAMQLQIY